MDWFYANFLSELQHAFFSEIHPNKVEAILENDESEPSVKLKLKEARVWLPPGLKTSNFWSKRWPLIIHSVNRQHGIHSALLKSNQL